MSEEEEILFDIEEEYNVIIAKDFADKLSEELIALTLLRNGNPTQEEIRKLILEVQRKVIFNYELQRENRKR